MPQLHWRQTERGCFFSATFLACLIGLQFALATPLAWLFLLCAFFTHVASVLDAIRQSSFPVYPRRMAWIVTSGALGFGVYAPAIVVAATTAWPCYTDDQLHEGYLINRWAYHATLPRQGHWVWLQDLPPFAHPCAARVVAIPGQQVAWDGRHWRIDGRDCPLDSQSLVSSWPQSYCFTVPDDQLLVEPEQAAWEATPIPNTSPTAHMMLVPSEHIVGRAWAQFSPTSHRHLL